VARLEAKVVKLEAKHIQVKNEMFEMECKLLKCLSDNKQYFVRKIKAISTISHQTTFEWYVSTCTYLHTVKVAYF